MEGPSNQERESHELCFLFLFVSLRARFSLRPPVLSSCPHLNGTISQDAGERGISGARATPRTLREDSAGQSPRRRARAGFGGSAGVGQVGASLAGGGGRG